MASFCGGVHHKKYNVERDKTFFKTKNVLLLKNTKSENLNKFKASKSIYGTIRKYYDKNILKFENLPYICLTVLNDLILEYNG
ncbi:hypothetical protein GCM10022422_33080 [Flavobacterium ginsengisoli]|uniref:Uncharacterized protein n=1 Tax=Flavobacterium ginsengisoli TaxID=871694 RepID=A0ABP7FUF6_9FLAO